MQKISKILLRIAVVITLFLCVFSFAYALGDYTVLTPLPGTTNTDNKTTNLSTYLPGVFTFAISIAAAMAFVMITYGGIMYMTSDAITGKTQGKEYITNAIYGLLLVIGSWVILNTINPGILKFNLTMATPDIKVVSDGVTALQPSTSAAINDLISKCPDCVRITSTVGDTHNTNSLHYKGLAVDIAPNTKLDAIIKTGQVGSLGGCTTYTQTFGGKATTFMWEPEGAKCGGTVASSGDHWHTTVVP